MEPLYVVRAPFNAHGIFHEVGEVIDDPSSIWLFRSRLGARDIVELTPDNPDTCNMWLTYMESRTTNPIDARVYELCGRDLPEGHPVLIEAQAQKDAEIAKAAADAAAKAKPTTPPVTPPVAPATTPAPTK